jgi:predicted transcriptional regulator
MIIAENTPNVNHQHGPTNGSAPLSGSLSDLMAMVQSSTVAPAQAEPEPKLMQRFQPLSLSDLLSMPPKEWLIDGLIGAGDMGMIYGAPGSAKTFVTVDLIFSACLGRQFAGRFDVVRPLNVAYCAGEGVSGLPARFGAAAQHYDIETMPTFTFFAVTPSLFCESQAQAQAESIQQFIIEWQERQADGQAAALDILIIDTLHSATAGADENSAKDMGIVLNLCKLATKLLGCAVILVHHSNKAGTGERGSSAMRGAMDVMIECRAVAGKFALSCEKLKDGEKWKEQTFDLVAKGESVRVWWDEPGDGETTDGRKSETAGEILALLGEADGRKLTTKQISEALDIKPQTANKVLARLEKEKQVERHQTERGTWCFSITPDGKDALHVGFKS